MLFNSINFLIFFPVVTTAFFLLPHKFRWVLLLAASSYFYMCFIPWYILILAFTILVDYIAGIYIEKAIDKRRKMFLVISIIANVGVLFVFKYFNFFNQNIADLASFLHWNYSMQALSLILPIGLSFHTFQSLSYTIEVYRGSQKAERNLGIFALYVMFFPQLVAGPIERAGNLLPQFHEKKEFIYERVVNGLRLMLWGFFKKIVIADRLAVYVNAVYGNVADYNGLHFIIATIFFAFQIYCDFSGYSDIAIGSAQVLGYDLMENFNRPYFSKSISEFWKRWHISLSSWFKDYLYIPLGGNRTSVFRRYLNLFIVFLVSGLWHGANWTFIAWGSLHGLYLVFSAVTKSVRERFVHAVNLHKFPIFHQIIQIAVTFILVSIGWIFFRANSIKDAFYIFINMFNWSFDRLTIVGRKEFILLILLVLFMELIQFMQRQGDIRMFFHNKPTWIRLSIYYALLAGILLLSNFGDNAQFIYFQF